ncbi:MAG: DMT family transporter [Chloroflexi bacterium]|nr:DMT family transporter [Chloroflexota bacterium]
MGSEERRGIGFVALAVLLFSTSPVLIRWAAHSLTSFEIAAGRLLVAALLVGGLALLRKEQLPARREWGRFAFYGLITALHFALYIASLEYTTIAHALALVYTAPIFVAIFSWLLLKESLSLRKWMGIGVAVAGVAVLAGFEPTLTPRMLIGDGLAVGSALCFGIYSVAGRSQRVRFPLIAYAGTVYAAGALWLLPVAAANFSPDGYSWPAILSVVALGALPLGLGHTLYNAALRRVSATVVNLVATQEVTGGIILGMLLLQEMPTFASLIGALVTLAGIVLVVL